MDGALGNFQPLCQFAGSDPALDLQKQQNGNQPVSAHKKKQFQPPINADERGSDIFDLRSSAFISG
jgi:hypothetical protein